MKKFNLFVSFILISFMSCDNEPVSDSFSFGLVSEFKINGEYHSADNSVHFRITEINDSRCPSDVVCIWAGKADVKIEVESPVSGSITLSTYDNPIDTVGNFSFEIIDVFPYPISTKTIQLEDYNVILKIVELTD